MSLRARIAAVASLSVALAVIAAAVGVYFAVRADLRNGIDSFLGQRARELVAVVAAARQQGLHGPGVALPGGAHDLRAPAGRGGAWLAGGRPPGVRPPGIPAGTQAPQGPAPGAPHPGGGRGDGVDGFPPRVRPPRFGAASGYAELILPSGSLVVPRGQGASPPVPPDRRDLAIARSGRGQALTDRHVHGTDLRVITKGAGSSGGAVLVARPLTEVNDELGELVPLLALVAGGGILLAAVLGALVARAALSPIARFTQRTEALTGGLDLSARLPVRGRDELSRLARSFNAMLAELERSVQAQRHLIADASHELRTPLASLRANIQVLGEADRLPAAEQESLRRDIELELIELGSLVGDVLELARGAQREGALDATRIDELVQHAVARAQRRPGPRIVVRTEPTLVMADARRVDRAISNLLENARKWSPQDGVIEVALRGGVLSVRDHGPGFQERDLPHVFDRFYRADRARNLPGSGLGLAIVRQVAEAHGGFAKAQNAAGGGALLSVSFGAPLPVNDQPHAGAGSGRRAERVR